MTTTTYTGTDGLTYVWDSDTQLLEITANGSSTAITSMSYSRLTHTGGTVSLWVKKIRLDGVTSICNNAFRVSGSYQYGAYLEEVDFGDALVSIGSYAFCNYISDSTVLLSYTLPATIASIGASAFGFSSTSPTSIVRTVTLLATTPPIITLSSQTSSLSTYEERYGYSVGLFCNLGSVNASSRIYVPADHVSDYTSATTEGWSYLASYIEGASIKDSNNNSYVLAGTTLTIAKGSTGTGVMPSFTTNVSDLSSDFSSATSVIFSGITEVGANAFNGMGITLSLPSGVTSVGNNAYMGVSWTTLTLPDTLTSIGANAFYYANSGKHEIYVGKATPAVLSASYNDCFGTGNDGLRIYVDTTNATVAAYQAAWVQYATNIMADMSTYTIHFNKNATNAVGTMADISANLNVARTLPKNQFTYANHSMQNWNTVSDGTGTSYADMGSVLITTKITELTLYAIWGTAYAYVVTFDANGGEISSGSSQSVTNDSGYIEVFPTAVRAGYTFDGWYTDTTYTTEFTSSTPVRSGNITVYAKWDLIVVEKANQCTLSKGDRTLYMPYVKSITDTYTANLNTLDTIIYGTENKFVMDLGTQEKYVFEFERTAPQTVYENSVDPELWSNEHWFREFIAMLDSWQNLNKNSTGALAGGFRLQFLPGEDYVGLYPAIDKNVFVSGTISADHGAVNTLQKLSFSVTFAVGSMVPVSNQPGWNITICNTKMSGSTPVTTDTTRVITTPYGVNATVPQFPTEWDVPDEYMFGYWSTNVTYVSGEDKIYPGTYLSMANYANTTLYPRWRGVDGQAIYTVPAGSEQYLYISQIPGLSSLLYANAVVTLSVTAVGGGGAGGKGSEFYQWGTNCFTAGGGGGSGEVAKKTYVFTYVPEYTPRVVFSVGGRGYYGHMDGRESYAYVQQQITSGHWEQIGMRVSAKGGNGGTSPSNAGGHGSGGKNYASGGDSGYAGDHNYRPAQWTTSINGHDGHIDEGSKGKAGAGMNGHADIGTVLFLDNCLIGLLMGGGGGGAANFDRTVNGTRYQSTGGNGGQGNSDSERAKEGQYGGGGGGGGSNESYEKSGGNGVIYVEARVG